MYYILKIGNFYLDAFCLSEDNIKTDFIRTIDLHAGEERAMRLDPEEAKKIKEIIERNLKVQVEIIATDIEYKFI